MTLLKRPSNRPFAGISMHDPLGNVFDLSQASMENRADVYADAPTGEQPAWYIRHFMLRTVDPDTVARFYQDVFDLREEEKASDDPNCYLSDGRVTLVVAPWKIADYAGTGIERPALDHLGFAVDSLEKFQENLERVAGRNPALAPFPMKRNGEGEARLKLLQSCR